MKWSAGGDGPKGISTSSPRVAVPLNEAQTFFNVEGHVVVQDAGSSSSFGAFAQTRRKGL